MPRVILGADLANSLYAAIGRHGGPDHASTANWTWTTSRPRAASFVVVGFLRTGMYEFDSRFVYIDLDAARDFFGYAPGGASMIGRARWPT